MPLENYEEIYNKKSWKTLSIQEPSQQLNHFFQWFKDQTYKWPEKQFKLAAQYVGKLWNALNYLEKQQITETLVFTGLDSNPILQYNLGFNAIAAQFQLEMMMLERLKLTGTRIGQEKVTRLITIHPKNLDDKEIQDSVLIQLKKHNPSYCVIRTTLEGVEDILTIPTLKTVVPIGHGFIRTTKCIFTCGPIEGMHDTVATEWAELLHKAPQVEHLKLVSCYYGLANPAFDDKLHGDVKYNTKKYARDSGRVTALVTSKPFEPLPFHPESFAAMIWQKLVIKEKRENFCLSATPLILNPLPSFNPTFFAASDTDHYVGGNGVGKPIWQDPKLRDIDKTKAICLATEDSFKLTS